MWPPLSNFQYHHDKIPQPYPPIPQTIFFFRWTRLGHIFGVARLSLQEQTTIDRRLYHLDCFTIIIISSTESLTMKLLLRSLPLLICYCWLPAVEAKLATTTTWSRLLREQGQQKQRQEQQQAAKRKLGGGVRGEKKDPDDDSASGKESKKKLAKKDKCNRDRRAVSFTTVFHPDDVNPITGSGVVGVEFTFEGDYTGNWTQTQIEVNDEIILGHDHLTFYDTDGEVVGAVTTQFDGTVDFAIVTAGYGIFACAQGSPSIDFPEDSAMVNVVWDLCVCYD